MSPADSEHPLLNEHQQRHFAVLLAMLQDALAEVEHLAAAAPPAPGSLTVYEDDLPAGFAESIRPIIASVRAGVVRLAAPLQLEPYRRSRARSIRAQVVSEIVRLEDSTAVKLRGYGDVDPRFAVVVEPMLLHLCSLLRSMIPLLDGQPAPKSTESDSSTTHAATGGGQMHGLKGERVLMRIHIGERDKFKGRPLHEAIVELLRGRHYAGATVLRAIMGFGASARLRTDRLEVLSLDLPLVIECIETEEKIRAILPELDEMIGGGLITLERAKVIMYRPHDAQEEGADDWSLDVTGSWQAQGRDSGSTTGGTPGANSPGS